MSPTGSLPMYPSSLNTASTDYDTEEDLVAVEALIIPTDEDTQEHDGSVATESVARNPTAAPVPLQDDNQVPAVETSLSLSASTPPPEFTAINLAETTPATPPTDMPSSSSAASIDGHFPPSTGLASTPIRNGCQVTVNKFISAQDSQSPSKHDHTDAIQEQDMGNVTDVRNLLLKELAGKIVEVDVSWARNLYKDIPKGRVAKIKGYLDTTEEYRNRRWEKLPSVAKYEAELYDPFTKIINSILHWSNLDGPSGSKRKAIDTHAKQLRHGGNSLFDNQTAAIGAQYTKLFDIHKEAELFVLLVVGLCTTDERLLGLDDTIQWTVGADGIRTGGTLRTVGPDKAPTTYTLLMEQKPWVRSSLLGRGIVCWPVQDQKGERLIVKDYWMSQGRKPEYEILEEVKGGQGLCQIVSYEVGRGETKDFRGPTDKFAVSVFHNSIAIRITMKVDAKASIDNFTSPEEMLAALRDAIAAHYALISKGLLHREICHDTVLIGLQGIKARVGERGILMHLDIAIGPVRTLSEFCKEVKSRMTLFQSWIMLKVSSLPQGLAVVPAHDYLDDLEAFFWLFCYLVFIYEPNGCLGPKTRAHDWVKGWMNHSTAFDVKNSFLTSDTLRLEVNAVLYSGWHDICLDLIIDFRDIIATVCKAKGSLIFNVQTPAEDGTVPNRFSDVLKDVNNIYARVIGLFDDALKKALDQSADNAKNPFIAKVNASSTTNTGTIVAEASEASGSNKRRAREPNSDSENEDSSMRQKRACPPNRIPATSTPSQPAFDDDDN
ncbi:hypothetical protein EST38_g4914 [Candolleomyces aberdarensis]|uniref:Fungal-type protein kinase domain-containing protein n=1 Tax=Candolleomyces aberdarensis TaxID=2316362 RepID=A0A4Q2DPQ0_9AGAR|nr:hypothetical protein EST38_g4914 [Candolleomyces aberdarensis]